MASNARTLCRILWYALQGKSHVCIPFLEMARPWSKFPHSCVCERFIYSQDRSTYFLQQNRKIDCGNIYCKSLTDTLMWKLGLWLRNSFSGNICFQFFCIGSLQCGEQPNNIARQLDSCYVFLKISSKRQIHYHTSLKIPQRRKSISVCWSKNLAWTQQQCCALSNPH
jgi:hypothetical protein